MVLNPVGGPTDPKELYEHLEVLLLATHGVAAELSLDYVVDALLRACVHPDPRIGAEAGELSRTISRWQRTYRPTDRERDADASP